MPSSTQSKHYASARASELDLLTGTGGALGIVEGLRLLETRPPQLLEPRLYRRTPVPSLGSLPLSVGKRQSGTRFCFARKRQSPQGARPGGGWFRDAR